MGSEPGTLSVDDIKKIAIGGALAALGAVASYLATVGPTFDQSTATGLVLAAAFSTAANLIRKWLTTTK